MMMNEPAKKPPRFTLLQLLAVVTIISVGLAILAPFINRMREASRRESCSSNLKELSLAVHEYHGVFNQFPPLATDEGHWTWMALILPMLERQRDYDRLQLHLPAGNGGNAAVARQLRDPAFLCPTRRSEAQRDGGVFSGGQPSDYVAVSTSTALAWSDQSDGMIVFRASPPTLANAADVRSATSFWSVTDGSAYTLMIGEKHMRPDWLGGEYDEPALVAVEDPNTIRVASDLLGRGLARDGKDTDPWKFGSWHRNVVLFAFGDASVRPVLRVTDPAILGQLSSRNGGTGATSALCD